MTSKRRNELRAKIVAFCSGDPKGKTHQEVAAEFKISGISAAAFLSGLVRNGALSYEQENDLFKKAK
jgi:hypothetical protein